MPNPHLGWAVTRSESENYEISFVINSLFSPSFLDFELALVPPSPLAASAIVSSLGHFGFIEPTFNPDGDNSVVEQIGAHIDALPVS